MLHASRGAVPAEGPIAKIIEMNLAFVNLEDVRQGGRIRHVASYRYGEPPEFCVERSAQMSTARSATTHITLGVVFVGSVTEV